MHETTAWHSHCHFITFITFLFTVNVIRRMAPLFFKFDSNKLWLDVQTEETLICAKFGNDLFNITKVRGRKTNWPRFFGLPGRLAYVENIFMAFGCFLSADPNITDLLQREHPKFWPE